MRYILRGSTVALALLVLMAVQVSAEDEKFKGRQYVELTNGKHVEGTITVRADGSYVVDQGNGLSVVIRKDQVRAIRPVREAEVRVDTSDPVQNASLSFRRWIEEDEIEQVLSGITANPDESLVGAGRDDMMAPLPLDEDSLREMLRDASLDWPEGKTVEELDTVLIKPHFIMVYTGSKADAQRLGSRLERVWAWNVTFLRMMNLPARRPESKLELYYFGEWSEFNSYSLNRGSFMPEGVLGYYAPDINRSHFFEMSTWPPVVRALEGIERMHWRDKQRITNWANRLVEHLNVEVIQHETGHHIHFNIGLFPRDAFGGNNVPVWLVEGTTMLFEVPPNAAGASLGVMNHDRLFELRQTFGEQPLTPEIWKTFIVENSLWYGGGGWGVAQSYYLGWALVYYLWKEHRAGYAKYLGKVFGREETLSRSELEAEFVECFGALDSKWFDKFYKFLSSLELKPSLVNPMNEEQARAQNVARRQWLDQQRGGGQQPGGHSGGRSGTSGGRGGRGRG